MTLRYPRAKFAKTDANCKVCGKLLKAGVRKGNQMLCCNGATNHLTDCQRTWYREKPKYIKCDVCGTRVIRTKRGQKRCVSDVQGEMSECQKIARRRICADNYKDRVSPDRTNKEMRNCLRCGEDFPSEGIHNRVCGRCNTANSSEAKAVHRMFVSGEVNSYLSLEDYATL